MEKKQKINIDEKELRKRRRERIIMVVVGILAITFTLIASNFFNKNDLPLSTNIFVYGLTSNNPPSLSDYPECRQTIL